MNAKFHQQQRFEDLSAVQIRIAPSIARAQVGAGDGLVSTYGKAVPERDFTSEISELLIEPFTVTS